MAANRPAKTANRQRRRLEEHRGTPAKDTPAPWRKETCANDAAIRDVPGQLPTNTTSRLNVRAVHKQFYSVSGAMSSGIAAETTSPNGGVWAASEPRSATPKYGSAILSSSNPVRSNHANRKPLHAARWGAPRVTRFSQYPVGEKIAYAQVYARKTGMAAFPLVGKVPALGLRSWIAFTARVGVYGGEAIWEKATGYALAPVQATSVVVLDVDSDAFAESIRAKFPALDQTFGTWTGYKGAHFYLTLAYPLPSALLSIKDAGHEIASLRGHGAYVVGPESDHASGRQYEWNRRKPIIQLDEGQTAALIALFSPPTAAPTSSSAPDAPSAGKEPPPPGSIYLWQKPTDYDRVRDDVARLFKSRGYRRNKLWLNGRCVRADQHANGDQHASYGFNTESGWSYCFCCGAIPLIEIAEALGVPRRSLGQPIGEGAPYAFTGATDSAAQLEAESQDDHVRSELNIATTLIRGGHYRAARFFDLLCQASRNTDGQHTYSTPELIAIGKDYGLSRTQVVKAAGALVKLGLILKTARGSYRRIAISAVQRLLGLQEHFAPVPLPRAVYRSLNAYKQAVVLAVQRHIPAGQSSDVIARAAGVSRRTLYRHENAAGVERQTQVHRVNVATATACHFVKVFDAARQFVRTISGDDQQGAMELAANTGGRAWAWQQRPSRRRIDFTQ